MATLKSDDDVRDPGAEFLLYSPEQHILSDDYTTTMMNCSMHLSQQSCHPIHVKAATDYTAKLPPLRGSQHEIKMSTFQDSRCPLVDKGMAVFVISGISWYQCGMEYSFVSFTIQKPLDYFSYHLVKHHSTNLSE